MLITRSSTNAPVRRPTWTFRSPSTCRATSTVMTDSVHHGRACAEPQFWPAELARRRPSTEDMRHTKFVSLEPVAEDHPTGVVWGLCCGLEPSEGTFFHWSDNGAYKAFTGGSLRTQDALVCFMNGASGLALMPEIASNLLPDPRPSLDWLGYGRHDNPARRILRAAQIRGAAAVWSDMASLGESNREWVARGLIAAGLDEDAHWLQERIEQTDGTLHRSRADPRWCVRATGAGCWGNRCASDWAHLTASGDCNEGRPALDGLVTRYIIPCCS